MTQEQPQTTEEPQVAQPISNQPPVAEQAPATVSMEVPTAPAPVAPTTVGAAGEAPQAVPAVSAVSENGLGATRSVPAGAAAVVPVAPAPAVATVPVVSATAATASVATAPTRPESAASKMPPKPSPVLTLEEMQIAEKAGALVMSARSAQRRGQMEAARAALRQALQLAPSDAGALEVLGDLYFEEGEQAKAIAVFEKGLRHHPRHTAFEEKIAVAKLDLAEMEFDRIRREQFLEHGDTEKWQDRNPGLAGSLSLVLPGAGQAYNDEYERGGIFFGVALFSLIAWYWPLTTAMRSVTESLPGGYKPSMGEIASTAMREMGAGGFFVYLMLFTWFGTHLFAAWDAAQLAINATEARKRSMGIS